MSVFESLKRSVHYGELKKVEQLTKENILSGGTGGAGTTTVEVSDTMPVIGTGGIWALENVSPKVYVGDNPPKDSSAVIWIDPEENLLPPSLSSLVTISRTPAHTGPGTIWVESPKGYRSAPIRLVANANSYATYGSFSVFEE